MLSWEALLHAAAKLAGAPAEPKAPNINVVSIVPMVAAAGENSSSEARALLDSGATHPWRRVWSNQEWDDASAVVVHLMNEAGTLLVPMTANTGCASSANCSEPRVYHGVVWLTMQANWHGRRSGVP